MSTQGKMYRQIETVQQPQFVGFNNERTGVGFTQRDDNIRLAETQGEIQYTIITNDRTQKNMKYLIDLKNIFARQLPKMPKEYIVKLVFDRNHQALVILKNNQKIIGGICYRLYQTQGFAEIAFLAVTSTEQVRGYGTRLMNVFKDQMQQKNISFLLTYADNYAIGYFKKQGFTQEQKIAQDKWKGYIKDYDGGTFMQCQIHPKMDYINISHIIKQQKMNLISIVKNICINEQSYQGSLIQKMAQQKKLSNSDLSLDFNQIPGIQNSKFDIQELKQLKDMQERSFYVQCQNLIEFIKKNKHSWPFIEPVNKDEVPDYYEIIKDPMGLFEFIQDIKTIEKNIQNNKYSNKEMFVIDLRKIFNNAKIYNQSETIYYKSAVCLEQAIEPYIHNLKDDLNNEFTDNMQINHDDSAIFQNKKIKK